MVTWIVDFALNKLILSTLPDTALVTESNSEIDTLKVNLLEIARANVSKTLRIEQV